MKILILTFYFEPDLSAGSFRATALVEKLSEKVGSEDRIDVLSTLPNRYASYEAGDVGREFAANVKVQRFALPPHRSGMLDQSKSFYRFASQVLRSVAGRRYDLVFATSSRLMTAALGRLVARKTGAALYLDIRDIFPDTLKDVLAGKPSRVLIPFFRFLERRTIKSATRINVVSEGFIDYFREIRRDIDFRTFTNGIDEEFLDTDFLPDKLREPKTILYAGNIGDGQGLHKILPQAAQQLGDSWQIKVIGDGGAKALLVDALDSADVANVQLLDPVNRAALVRHYKNADILFLHLNDYEAFLKVLPSKIFEYAATGKAMLAGVGGYAAQFINKHVENAAVFAPCRAAQMLSGLGSLKLELTPRETFIKQFSRAAIIDEMANDVIDAARSSSTSTRNDV